MDHLFVIIPEAQNNFHGLLNAVKMDKSRSEILQDLLVILCNSESLLSGGLLPVFGLLSGGLLPVLGSIEWWPAACIGVY